MPRIITFLFLLCLSFSFGQNVDSVKAKTQFFADTLSVKSDSVFVNDSSLVKTARDSIAPLFQTTLSDKNFLISQNEMLKSDYRYTGDYLKLFPFNFIKDLGFIGQPNETFLYGIGNNGISYLIDGVSFNNRFDNSLNLNLLQSEDIDSIEVVPLPRGFLYGANSNPVSVNFITKDFVLRQPYSRIKYYQGPDRESLFDGSFNALVWRRLTASFDITNRIVDETFRNTEFSIWQAKLKLKYFVSNSINIIASYNYNDYRIGLNGGVDIDSVKSITDNINSILYDPLRAPVLYPLGELKTLTHFPRLRFLIKPVEWLRTDASLFFIFSRDEKNTSMNEYSENKTYGLNIRNDFDYSIFKFQLNVDYEKRDIYSSRYYYSSIDPMQLNAAQYQFDADLFSVSGILSANLDGGTFIPSIYYKTSSYKKKYSQPMAYNDEKTSHGIGLDLLFKIKSSFGFYFGTSVLKPYNSSKEYTLIELGTRYQNEFIFADLKYFYNEYTYGFSTGGNFFDNIRFGNLNGLGLNLKFNYWKFLLESNSSFYYAVDSKKLVGVPKFKTQTGLYFNSFLFDDNLDLKTGFVFYYLDDLNTYSPSAGLINIAQANKLDFTLSGEIQKLATIYFVWENLINNQYFITPYYPMPVRTVRFGVAWEFLN